MRLFLSSQDLGRYADVAAKMAGNNMRAALIRNAGDDKPEVERGFTTSEKIALFAAVGFDVEEIDLRDYFNKTEELESKLKGFGSVWCAGGNTFILRRAMKASGFDQLVVNMLSKDQILYGGWSAGACITAKSLDGIDRGDRPNSDIVPDSYPSKETIWEGLGLVDFMIVPHIDQEWGQHYADESITRLKELGVDYRPLSDGQVIVIDGEREELLS